jgi:hypothetical protein
MELNDEEKKKVGKEFVKLMQVSNHSRKMDQFFTLNFLKDIKSHYDSQSLSGKLFFLGHLSAFLNEDECAKCDIDILTVFANIFLKIQNKTIKDAMFSSQFQHYFRELTKKE